MTNTVLLAATFICIGFSGLVYALILVRLSVGNVDSSKFTMSSMLFALALGLTFFAGNLERTGELRLLSVFACMLSLIVFLWQIVLFRSVVSRSGSAWHEFWTSLMSLTMSRPMNKDDVRDDKPKLG